MGYMSTVRSRSALGLEEREALAARINHYMSLRIESRTKAIEEVSRAYGVSGRVGYRYAKAMREHQCYCAVCGRTT